MASFKKAVEEVLLWEGGYSNDPDDPGGRTNFGISSKHHPEIEDVGSLTIDDAIAIYYQDYWTVGKVYMVENQHLANKLMSMGVNTGIYRATLHLQRALRAVGTEVTLDGIMGPETASAVNLADPRALLAAYKSEVANYYRFLIFKKPHKIKYEKGWLRRAYA